MTVKGVITYRTLEGAALSSSASLPDMDLTLTRCTWRVAAGTARRSANIEGGYPLQGDNSVKEVGLASAAPGGGVATLLASYTSG